MKKFILATVASSVILSACGGKSDNVTTIPTTPPVTVVNQTPVMATSNADQTGTVGTPFSYDAKQGGTSFNDPDGDALTYTVSYSPSAMGLSDADGVISGTPTGSGTITVTITATDSSGASATDSFHIVLSPLVPVNQAPVTAAANADQTGMVGTQLNYDATQGGASFTDPDGDALTYTVAYSPAAQGLTDTNGVISGTPSAAGTVTVTITATDPSGATATDSFDVVISPAAPVNQAPVLAAANADQTAMVGTQLNYDATQGATSFTDPDGDALTYTVAYSPAAQGLTDANGVISGTPSTDGTVTVTVTATDPSGATATDDFDIVISPQGTDQDSVIAQFAGRIDLDNLEDYENQTVPDYILKLNDGGNPISNEGATLGRVLFYDPALSIDDTISCSSCHSQETAFSDVDVQSTGVEGALTGRHSMRMINLQFTDATNFFWDNRATSLEDQETDPLVDHNEHGFSGVNGRPDLDDLITKLEAIDYYQELFTFVYGDAAITEERLQLALAQFAKSIWSFDSKYDAGRAQVTDDFQPFPNFTADENTGKILYLDGPADGGAGCQRCHLAPEFDISPLSLHNGVIDVAGSPGDTDFTNVRSPSLRDMVGPNGESNGPFMHDGSQATLMEVINHYNVIPVPTDPTVRAEFMATIDPLLIDDMGMVERLGLNAMERQQLRAFLLTLSGTSVYTDTKYSDPF